MYALELIVATVLPLLLATAFLLGRHLPRRRRADSMSPVARQHYELLQGGSLNATAVEKAKERYREMLEHGDLRSIEASLRAGTQYAVRVRALAEIGTDDVAKILERQLNCKLCDDRAELAWYRIDVASSLRMLQSDDSLPELLLCAEAVTEVPLAHFLAAETVCFLAFPSYLAQSDTSLGRASLRVLLRVFEGLTSGMPPYVVAEAKLGDIVEDVWDMKAASFDPLLVRLGHQVLRYLRRVPHSRRLLESDEVERESFDWQISRMEGVETQIHAYLDDAKSRIPQTMSRLTLEHWSDLLSAIDDTRTDTGTLLLKCIADPTFPHTEHAIRTLTWSKDPGAGKWLRLYAQNHVRMLRRARWRPRAVSPARSTLTVPYSAILGALRGHPSLETERFLLVAARDWDPAYRKAAVGSLGWWEPLARMEVLAGLGVARRDPSPEVRQAARAALARLGERQALHWFRQSLLGGDEAKIHEALQIIAADNIVFLWPEVDQLADSNSIEIYQRARETLAVLSEEMDRGPSS